jgi:hypothetical protein
LSVNLLGSFKNRSRLHMNLFEELFTGKIQQHNTKWEFQRTLNLQ